MADQCIVCLEDLDALDLNLEVAANPTPEQQSTYPSKSANNEPVALIKPCNHVLHDECLRAWSQKANSCPICRQTFNLVEVLDKVGGMFPLHYNSKFPRRTKIRNRPVSAELFHASVYLILCLGILLARLEVLGH